MPQLVVKYGKQQQLQPQQQQVKPMQTFSFCRRRTLLEQIHSLVWGEQATGSPAGLHQEDLRPLVPQQGSIRKISGHWNVFSFRCVVELQQGCNIKVHTELVHSSILISDASCKLWSLCVCCPCCTFVMLYFYFIYWCVLCFGMQCQTWKSCVPAKWLHMGCVIKKIKQCLPHSLP